MSCCVCIYICICVYKYTHTNNAEVTWQVYVYIYARLLASESDKSSNFAHKGEKKLNQLKKKDKIITKTIKAINLKLMTVSNMRLCLCI